MRRVLKRIYSRVKWRIRFGIHSVLRLVRGHRPLHIIVTGPDDLLAETIAPILAHAFGVKEARVSRGSGKALLKGFARLTVATDPNALRLEKEQGEQLSRYRQAIFVVALDDPRNLVSERSARHPHLWRQGFDYRLVVNDRGQQSVTDPGVMDRLADGLTPPAGTSVVVVRRDSLATGIQAVITQVSDTLPRRSGEFIESEVNAPALEEKLVSSPWQDSAERRLRVARQIALCPDLEVQAIRLGYEPSSPNSANLPIVNHDRGTIIAFHTPDEVYRGEAARLEKSLKRLGLPYQIKEVEPEKNWVRTTLLKPSWILPVREALSGPLLYIDVDAFVHQDPWPYLASMEGDMATFVGHDGAFNSATIWINDTEGAREILRRWSTYSDTRRDQDSGQLKHQGDHGDQGVLQVVIEEDEASSSPTFRYGRLPVNLTYIFDRPHLYRYGPVYIEQLQASRETSENLKRLERRRQRLLELGA